MRFSVSFPRDYSSARDRWRANFFRGVSFAGDSSTRRYFFRRLSGVPLASQQEKCACKIHFHGFVAAIHLNVLLTWKSCRYLLTLDCLKVPYTASKSASRRQHSVHPNLRITGSISLVTPQRTTSSLRQFEEFRTRSSDPPAGPSAKNLLSEDLIEIGEVARGTPRAFDASTRRARVDSSSERDPGGSPASHSSS